MKRRNDMQDEQRQAVFLGTRHYFVLLVLLSLLAGLVSCSGKSAP
jgi:hypothetical protein